jgi:hypothetical protein
MLEQSVRADDEKVRGAGSDRPGLHPMTRLSGRRISDGQVRFGPSSGSGADAFAPFRVTITDQPLGPSRVVAPAGEARRGDP